MTPVKPINLYSVEPQEDGTVRVITDLSPDEMYTLLKIGFMACIQQGVMLASLAEKMGVETTPFLHEERQMETEVEDPSWEELLDQRPNNLLIAGDNDDD